MAPGVSEVIGDAAEAGESAGSPAGGMLNRWRTGVAGLPTAAAAASLLGVGRGVWSSWEDSEPIPADRLRMIDELFQAGGTFTRMMWAVTNPGALAPRRYWAHNLQGKSAPAWVWLRNADPDESTVRVRIRWGPVVAIIERDAPDGLIVTTPVSIPNPPVEIHFATSGWADFGRGYVPTGLGYPTVSGVRLMRSPRPEFSTWVVVNRLRQLVGHRREWRALIRHLLGDHPFVDDALAVEEPPVTAVDLTAAVPTGPPTADKTSGVEYRRIRDARGQFRKPVLARLNELDPSAPVTYHQLNRFEEGSEPLTLLLRARLDHVYEGGGALCREPVATVGPVSPGGDWIPPFPSWWIGPVWVHFVCTTADQSVPEPAAVRLLWYPWVKDIRLRSGTTVALRRAIADGPDLRVTAPPGWTVTAGVGFADDAHDVNHLWRPVDERAMHDVWTGGRDIFLAAFGATRGEATRLAFKYRLRRSLRR